MFEITKHRFSERIKKFKRWIRPTVFVDIEGKIIKPRMLGRGSWPKFFFQLDGAEDSGYVEIAISAPPYLSVEHFAISGLLKSRRGIGVRMARELAKVAKRQGIEKIIFWQTRPAQGHHNFFSNKMGMTTLAMEPGGHPQAYLWVINPDNEDARVNAQSAANTHPTWTTEQYYVDDKVRHSIASSRSLEEACDILDAQAKLLKHVPSIDLENFQRYAMVASTSIMRSLEKGK